MVYTHRILRGPVTLQGNQKAPRIIITRSLTAIIGVATAAHFFAPGSVETGFTTFGLITLAALGIAFPVLFGTITQRRLLLDSRSNVPLDPLQDQKRHAIPQAPVHRSSPSHGAPALQGERKQVTVMFADLSGFTSMAENLDAEEVRDIVNSCFQQVVPVLSRYGGTTNKFLGDAILALFGAPTAHENDPERALRAALEMQGVLAAFNRERGTGLKMHFGINTGLVVAGGVGSADQSHYSVIGDAVNLAARLQDASGTGEIFVGPETYRLTHHMFEFESIGHLKVKGRAEPVPAFKLLRTRARPVGAQMEARGGCSTLVGRNAELAIVMERVQRLKSGQGGVLSIVGEAGLGKSRLIAEARRMADEDDVCWLETGGLSTDQHISYGPFIEIIQADSDIATSDGEDERWWKLEKRINALFPDESRDLLPYLAALLNIDMPAEQSERLKHLDPEAIGPQVFRSTRRFFAASAEKRPLVLVLEDIHWLDESSINLLEHLLPLCVDVPLLIVLTSRRDQDGPMQRVRLAVAEQCGERYSEVRLSALPRSDTAQLVRNLIHADELPFGLLDIVSRRAEGNPLFVEEVVRTLVDLGGLKREEATGRWNITERVEQIPIPDTLIAVIAARIDRLSDAAKEVLKLASVIGRSFRRGALEGIAEPHQSPAGGLLELLVLGLVSEKHRYPEPEYVFKHGLVQEATYASILLRRRRELHRRVAEYMEASFADHLDDFYSLVAYHYTKAEAWTKAQEYLLKAGNQARRIAADAEALAHYQQALTAYGHAIGDEWDPMERAVLESNMGEALYRRGEHGHGRRHLERALRALGRPYPTSRWGIHVELVRQIARQILHRAVPALFVKPVTIQVDRVSAELSRQYQTLKWMDFFLDGERYMLSTLLLLNHAERCGHAAGIVRASSGLEIGLDAIRLRRLGEFYHRRSDLLASETGEPRAIGDAYMLLGIHEEYTMGKIDTAREYLRRGADGYWEAGSIKGWAAASTLTGRSMARLGDVQGALALFRHVIRVAEDAAEHQAQGWGLIFEGEMMDVTGSFEGASARLLRAIELFREVPDYMSSVLARGILGKCYIRWGKLSKAQEALEEGRRTVVEHGLRGFMCTPMWQSLAEVDLAVAEQSHGAARKAAIERACRSSRAALRQAQVDEIASASAYRIQGSLQYVRGKFTEANKWWRRSLKYAEMRGMGYELGMTHLEIGWRTGDFSHLRSAESLFAKMDARFDLAQAREHLRSISIRRVA